MAYATNGSVSLRYEVGGSGPPVVLVGDIGLGVWQFGWQHGALAGPYTVVAPELRGIGESDAPQGPYSVDELAADVDAILSAEGIRKAHFVGYGFGGTIALAYAMESSRPESLTVIGTPPSGDAYASETLWADPNDREAVKRSLNALFEPAFREERPEALTRIADWRVREDASPAVFEAQHSVLAGFDITDRLYELTTPTLVLHGLKDRICPPSHGRTLADGLPRGEFHGLDGVGHGVWISAARAVSDEIVGWLAEHTDTDR